MFVLSQCGTRFMSDVYSLFAGFSRCSACAFWPAWQCRVLSHSMQHCFFHMARRNAARLPTALMVLVTVLTVVHPGLSVMQNTAQAAWCCHKVCADATSTVPGIDPGPGYCPSSCACVHGTVGRACSATCMMCMPCVPSRFVTGQVAASSAGEVQCCTARSYLLRAACQDVCDQLHS
jgi:hypothetical protein